MEKTKIEAGKTEAMGSEMSAFSMAVQTLDFLIKMILSWVLNFSIHLNHIEYLLKQDLWVLLPEFLT